MGHIGIKVVHCGTFQNVTNPHSISAGVCVIGLEGPVLLYVFRCGGLAGLPWVFLWVQPLKGLESSTPSKEGRSRPKGA